jgi:hypothetical protein
MGHLLMKFLIAEYCVVFVAFAYDGNWAKAFYFLSAAGISLSVLWMK